MNGHFHKNTMLLEIREGKIPTGRGGGGVDGYMQQCRHKDPVHTDPYLLVSVIVASKLSVHIALFSWEKRSVFVRSH